MKIGILGGTFDPFHNGHLFVADNAFSYLKLDMIIFIPNGNPPHKNNVIAKKADRLNMIKLSIKNNPNYHIDEYEINKDDYSYSYKTLEYLHEKYPNNEFFFLAGADNIAEIEKWKNPKRIFELATIVFLARPSYKLDNSVITSLKEKYKAKIIIFNLCELDISATMIRQNINNKNYVKPLLQEDVYNYIIKNEVYNGNNR